MLTIQNTIAKSVTLNPSCLIPLENKTFDHFISTFDQPIQKTVFSNSYRKRISIPSFCDSQLTRSMAKKSLCCQSKTRSKSCDSKTKCFEAQLLNKTEKIHLESFLSRMEDEEELHLDLELTLRPTKAGKKRKYQIKRLKFNPITTKFETESNYQKSMILHQRRQENLRLKDGDKKNEKDEDKKNLYAQNKNCFVELDTFGHGYKEEFYDSSLGSSSSNSESESEDSDSSSEFS